MIRKYSETPTSEEAERRGGFTPEYKNGSSARLQSKNEKGIFFLQLTVSLRTKGYWPKSP